MISTNVKARSQISSVPLAPLQASKIQSALTGNAADLGILPEFRKVRSQFSVHTFQSLPSTNAKLWEMIADGAPSGTVAIAQTQTAGRGQRGRHWQSSLGGLYLSLALEPSWPATHIAQLTCISAWGIATAFNNLGIPIKIKWPNDLFFEGKKLGGILTETKLSQSASDSSAGIPSADLTSYVKRAVIGVGINWHNSVPANATTLSKILASLPQEAVRNKINCLEMLAALVLKGILQGYLFQQRVGSQDFMKAYSNLLTQVGEVVSLESDLLSLAVVRKNSLDKYLLSKIEQLAKRSGEVVGISEEGYLKVALRDIPATLANDLSKVSSGTLPAGNLPIGNLPIGLVDESSESQSSASELSDKSSECITPILLLRPAGFGVR